MRLRVCVRFLFAFVCVFVRLRVFSFVCVYVVYVVYLFGNIKAFIPIDIKAYMLCFYLSIKSRRCKSVKNPLLGFSFSHPVPGQL